MRHTENTGRRGKDKTSGTRREKKREGLFNNCFSLLDLLYIVH
jgi:hypothetical protein